MTSNNDAQIAREWALRAVESAENTQPVSRGALAAARHILATTTPPTMADLKWDDDVHAGQNADHLLYGEVRMLVENSVGDIQILYVKEGRLCYQWVLPADLTPIPGTKIDLTPRRESEPESTPDHPAVLTTAAEYLHAPAGTVVAAEGEEAWTKNKDGYWEKYGIISEYDNYAMSDEARQVLRWGPEA